MIKKQDPREQLSGLQEEQLFALARNESAQWLYRKLAASLLKENGYLKANHPEIAHVLAAFLADVVPVSHESEVSASVENVIKGSPDVVNVPNLPQKATIGGPFKASVTTETMSASEVVK